MDVIGSNTGYNKGFRQKSFGVIAINKIAVIQYFLIYLSIQYIGGRVLAAIGSDLFYAGTIFVCLLVMILFPLKIPLYKSSFIFLVVLSTSLIFTVLITSGALSIGTVLSLLSRFLLIYVTISIDSENFLRRFIKLVIIMAVISLIEYFFVLVAGQQFALRFFSKLYEIKNAHSFLGSSYGLFFVCYNFMDPLRNAYMFGEPGEYQALLITALYFITFFENNYKKNTKIKYYIILILTLITVQSTTGYFNLIAFAVVVLFSNRKIISPIIRNIIICGIILLIVYLIFWYSENSFIYRNFIAKIIGEGGSVDLSVKTGAARIGPIKRFWQTLVSVPHKLIFGVGYDGLSNLPLGGFTTCGLINSIAMTGMISSFIYYGAMLGSLLKNSKSFFQTIFALFVVVNMGLSQPDLLSIMSVLICMYGICLKQNNESKCAQI